MKTENFFARNAKHAKAQADKIHVLLGFWNHTLIKIGKRSSNDRFAIFREHEQMKDRALFLHKQNA